MSPNIRLSEQLMFERAKEWQRQIEQQYLLNKLRQPEHRRESHPKLRRPPGCSPALA